MFVDMLSVAKVWDGLDELLLFFDRPRPLPAACSDSWTGVTNSRCLQDQAGSINCLGVG